jgi:hypothetical protein
MDPVIFEFLGGLLVGAMVGVMTVLKARQASPKTRPMLAVRKSRTASSVRRRRTAALASRDQNTGAFAKTRRKNSTKAPGSTVEPIRTVDGASLAAVSFDTCPSCGLQAPGSLLAEHFLGSPSHRNGLPKVVQADPVDVEAAEEAEEEDSKQSVRNLLQMLVPPRAFGRRHAHRSVSPISSIVKELGPPRRNYP